MIENLAVYPQNMQKNLDKLGGLVFSQRVLLALIEDAKISREIAYKIVQNNAMKVWQEGADFLTLLKNDAEVKGKISDKKLEELFDNSYHTKNIDVIFEKVFA